MHSTVPSSNSKTVQKYYPVRFWKVLLWNNKEKFS